MNAIFVIDKPSGMTSHDVVARVRRIIRERSVGHLGTLDPMASGVLPLVTGKFTRLAQFFGDAEKEYEGTIRFGWETDTCDAEGERMTDISARRRSFAELDRLADSLRGPIMQIPPAYSAKKIKGTPAYKLARGNVAVELEPVAVEVRSFDLLEVESEDEIGFGCTVSAGTYVRALARDLGREAGCGAHLGSLRRVRAGAFAIDEALTLEQLEARAMEDGIEGAAVHPRSVLLDLPSVTADQEAMAKIRHGNAVNLPELSRAPFVKVFQGQAELVAIAKRVAGTLFQPKVVLV